MKRLSKLAIVAVGLLAACQQNQAQAVPQKSKQPADEKEHYTFILNDKVTRKKVSFKNRYGIILSGELYLPKEKGTAALAAIAISGPFGAVKEQSSGLYDNQMAARGFMVLAFDPSYTGESGGTPRNIAASDINTEDFSAAVDFLGLQPGADRNKIGIIGICGFGGFALNATAVDKRIKAVVTTSIYDIPRASSKGYYDKLTLEERSKILEDMSWQRWEDAAAGQPEYGECPNPDILKGNEPQFVKDYFDYYKTPRGFHPRAINSNAAWTKTNGFSLMNMPILSYIKEIAPRPILMIAGEEAHSRYFSEDIYKAAAEPKELLLIPGAVHVDLYDKTDIIPFGQMEAFFKQYLQ